MRKQRTRTCPECNQEFPNREQVALHALHVHLSMLTLSLSPRCWCRQELLGPWILWPRPKEDLDAQAKILLAHCDRHGGMQTHYTACLLGID